MRAFARFAVILCAALAATACGPDAPKFKASDVTGTAYGRGFELLDHTGKPRTLVDYRGKAVVLFFGYTQCPDVCPTTLSELAEAMKRLGPDADRVQVLFVTIDPERDTPALLAHYVRWIIRQERSSSIRRENCGSMSVTARARTCSCTTSRSCCMRRGEQYRNPEAGRM